LGQVGYPFTRITTNSKGVKMVLTIYNSKRDVYGNVYYACKLTNLGKIFAQGTLTANNINTLDIRENLKWEQVTIELPIREFNKLTKTWPCFGCKWENIRSNLTVQIEDY
jgi:hypothetical protein